MENKNDFEERLERVEYLQTKENQYEKFMNISSGILALSASALMIGMVIAEIIAILMKFK